MSRPQRPLQPCERKRDKGAWGCIQLQTRSPSVHLTDKIQTPHLPLTSPMAVRSLMVLLVPPMGVAMPLNPAGSMLLASSFSAAARESMVSGTGVKDCGGGGRGRSDSFFLSRGGEHAWCRVQG